MICEKCGMELSDDMNFCPSCGTVVTKTVESSNNQLPVCRKCGAQLLSDARFCLECGEPVQTVSPPDPQLTQKTVSFESAQEKVQKRKKQPIWYIAISLLCILTLLIAVSILIYIKRDGQYEPGNASEPVTEAGKKFPIVVLACPEDTDLQLLYYSDFHKPKHPVVITTYDRSRISGYFNDEGNGVFFSNDGKYLYYFDPNSDIADDGGCALYRVLTEELNKDMVSPELIDDYVVMNRLETSYVMETLDNDRVLYMGVGETDEGYCYKLSMYKDGSSSTLLTGKEIFVSVNRDRTLANIAVMNDNHENINDWTWYRMDLGENSAPQFVCEGVMYPCAAMQDYDYQVLTDHDMIINIMDRGEDNGYGTVDLYEHGKFSKKVLEYYPRSSVGPFGITVKDNQDVSFFTISTADGNSTKGKSYQGFSQSWAFFQYKDGAYQEVSGISRFQNISPSNEVELSSLRSVGDSVMYAKKNTVGSYCCWHYKVLDGDGNEILLELKLGSGDNTESPTDALYAETIDKKKRFIEGEDIDEEIYDLDGKKYLVAYDYYNYKFFSLCLDDLTADSIDNVEAVVEMDECIEQVLPCDTKTILVMTNNGLYEWDGQELKDSKLGSIIGTESIYSIWSRGRRIGYNIPNNY